MNKVFFLFILAGCSFIPKLHKVRPPIPHELPKTSGPHAKSADGKIIPRLHWRDLYQLPELRRIIAMGLKHNRDLRRAMLTVEEVRAMYDIQRSELFPNISLTGSYVRQKIPPNALKGNSFGGVSGAGGTSPTGFFQKQYRLGVGITNYEMDLFGRIRSLKKAALEEYLASEAARDTVKIMLISDIATAYFKLLGDKALLGISQMTAESQKQTMGIIQNRFQEGITSELDLRQAQTLYETAKADAISYSREVILDENVLNLLVGKKLDYKNVSASFQEAFRKIGKIPVGLSSKVLLDRPDIKQAEHLLRSANANIGAARAAFFPALSLTTSVGKLSSETSNLFDKDSNTWLFTPQITLPLFTGGRNQAGLKVAEVRKEERIVDYEKAIQMAFREASDAIVSQEKLQELLKAQESVVKAVQRSYELSHERYRTGVSDFLNELDARRGLYEAQRIQIQQQQLYFSNLSFLYRTLGGGVE